MTTNVKFSNTKTIQNSFNSWNIIFEDRGSLKFHFDFLTKKDLIKYYGIEKVKKIGFDQYFTRNKTIKKIPIYSGIPTKNLN